MYSATYKQKQTLKLAPDAVIKINKQLTTKICEYCDKEIVISNYLTSISTNLSTAGTVGTAGFTISMPRHGHNGTYMVRGGRVYGVHLMDEIEIFIKGRFKDINGNYPYYKSFWGLVTEIDERYVAGNQEITVNCESMLKWLQLMKTNEHPSGQVFSDTIAGKYDAYSTFWAGKSFAKLNAYEIVYSMLDITFKNLVVTNALNQERTNKQTTYTNSDGKQVVTNSNVPIVAPKEYELITAWKKRFDDAGILNALKMYGVTNDSIKLEENNKQAGTNAGNDVGLAACKDSKSAIAINYDYGALMDYRPFNKPDDRQEMDWIHSTYKNNLTIIEEVKMFTGFEFYLDTTGDFVFKPPFWNLDVRQNPVYVINDQDIINWNWSESDAEVVTRVEVTGSLFNEVQIDSYMNPTGVYTNYALARQFGIKVETITMRFFRTANFCYYHAISELDRFNSHRFKGSVTILGRPELRLGLPVYFPTRDCFAYIENISHSFSFGGTFTTALSLSSVRRKYNPETSINIEQTQTLTQSKKDKNFQSGEYFLILENTGSTAEQNFTTKEKQLATEVQAKIVKEYKTKQKSKNMPVQTTASEEATALNLESEPNAILKTNRAGNYKEYHIKSKEAQAALKDFKAAKMAKDTTAYLKVLDKAIPLSDSDGYELVGIYENGKSLFFDENNILRNKSDAFSKQAANDAKNSKPSTDDSTGVNADLSAVLVDIPKSSNIPDFLTYSAESLSTLTPISVKETKQCQFCQDPGLQDIVFKRSLNENRTLQDTINNTNK